MTYRPSRVRKQRDPDTTIFAAGCLIWALGLLLGLAFWGGVIYVVLHFLAKVW